MLSALVKYYDQLLQTHPGEVARPGWCACNVKFIVQLSCSGAVHAIVRVDNKNGSSMIVPEQVQRTSGVKPNFLCDNSSFILGIDTKGNPARTAKCFAAARELHLDILRAVDSPSAQAVVGFFETWSVESAREHPTVVMAGEELLAGGNLVFAVVQDGVLHNVLDDYCIAAAWDKRALSVDDADSGKDAPLMRCLVTGKKAPIARLHPRIQGVYGAQSAGAPLVNFNARAFESYGHVDGQGRNAPVSIDAARAYFTALQYLLRRPDHHMRLGDTTLVYWSEQADDENAALVSRLFGNVYDKGEATTKQVDASLRETLRSIASGRHRTSPELDATFYIVGLAPNAARLSVRFFLQDSFGNVMQNVARHYERIAIAHHPNDREYLSPFQLLYALENPNAKKPVAMSVLATPFLQAILQNKRYPESAFMLALQRTFASQDNAERRTKKVSRARIALIKAYLLKNYGYSDQEVTVELNEQRNSTAYSLGRAFALLEHIQETANGSSNISGRYLNSACATPAVTFPVLLKLANAHLRKAERSNPGRVRYFRAQLASMIGEEKVPVFPARLALAEQGDFLLGYWHQERKRYEGKPDAAASEDVQMVSD